MAKFRSTIFCELSKSMADNTFYRSRGQNIVRTKIGKNTSKTLKQQMQREKMKEVFKLSDTLLDVSDVGFPGREIRLTASNAFTRANSKAVTVTKELEVTVDYEKLLVSKGKRYLPESISATADAETHSLTITYEAEEFGRRAEGSDTVYAAVLEKSLMRAKLYTLGERQASDPAVVAIPQSWAMENLEVYAFVVSANGREASDSIHLTLG